MDSAAVSPRRQIKSGRRHPRFDSGSTSARVTLPSCAVDNVIRHHVLDTVYTEMLAWLECPMPHTTLVYEYIRSYYMYTYMLYSNVCMHMNEMGVPCCDFGRAHH